MSGNPRQSSILYSMPWIPVPRYCIPVFLVKLGLWIPILSRILDSLSCILNSKAQDSGFNKPNFHGFRIPQAKLSRIPGSGFFYMGRNNIHIGSLEVTIERDRGSKKLVGQKQTIHQISGRLSYHWVGFHCYRGMYSGAKRDKNDIYLKTPLNQLPVGILFIINIQY